MHIFALSISVLVTTAGNGARFCATLAPKIGPRKCFILTLRRLSVVHRKINYNGKYSLNSIIPIKTFVNRINMLVQSPLEDAVQDLVAGLVKPHSVSPHKTVQVSIEEISNTLNKISAKLDALNNNVKS